MASLHEQEILVGVFALCPNMQLRAMKQIAVQTAEEVLRDKVSVASQATADDAPLPHVRVTVGAHAFDGIPVRIEDRRNEPWLVLVERDTVAYLPLRSITTVIVDHVSTTAPAEPATKFALERTRKEIEAIGKTAGWAMQLAIAWPADPTEDDRRSVAGVLEGMRTALPAITADQLGRSAAKEIKRITLVPTAGRDLVVARKDTALTITIGMAADLREATVRSMIEKHL
jgi:hypothetical protein